MLAAMLLEEAGPNTELGWLFYLFLGFFFLMVIVGWLVSRQGGMPTEVPHEAHVPHQVAVVADDLVSLEGIGPRVAGILNADGITTFEALANADPAEIQKTLSAAGLQMMNPEGWIEQARLAARGEWAELEKLQNELKGGRRK